MEIVNSKEDIAKLEKNRVEGNPEITNSKISFKGINNILFCEGNVKITNANFAFEGNNSIVYLSSAMNSQYSFTLIIYNNSTFFIGKEGICQIQTTFFKNQYSKNELVNDSTT